MKQREKPNYKLRFSDFKPWIGLDDYITRNPDNDLRVSSRETFLSVYNLVIIGGLIAAGWAVFKGNGLDSLFN